MPPSNDGVIVQARADSTPARRNTLNIQRRLAAACALSLAACLPLASVQAQAVELQADGQWAEFYIDEMTAQGGGLGWIDTDTGLARSFEFSVPTGFTATLTVVDGGFAGDVFGLTLGGVPLGSTSAVGSAAGTAIGVDFDAALADVGYSRGVFTLQAGSYSLGGLLLQSATFEGVPINATVGGLRLQVSPVPEPGSLLMLLAGLPLVAFGLRRRLQGDAQ